MLRTIRYMVEPMCKTVKYAVLLFSFIIYPIILFPLHAATLHIAVASNFTTPIKELALNFEKETGHSLKLSFASSGKLFAQIQHHAPYDIFLSADESKPKELINNGLAQAKSFIIYTEGRLALWSMSPISTSSIKQVLLDSPRIAVANPRLAPYGKAAKESLHYLSIWEDVRSKLVQGENINQAYQYTYSKNAKIGLVALSQVFSKSAIGYKMEIPKTFHSDINQAGVILSRTKNAVLAEAFMTFLMRSDTQADISKFGYSTKNN